VWALKRQLFAGGALGASARRNAAHASLQGNEWKGLRAGGQMRRQSAQRAEQSWRGAREASWLAARREEAEEAEGEFLERAGSAYNQRPSSSQDPKSAAAAAAAAAGAAAAPAPCSAKLALEFEFGPEFDRGLELGPELELELELERREERRRRRRFERQWSARGKQSDWAQNEPASARELAKSMGSASHQFGLSGEEFGLPPSALQRRKLVAGGQPMSKVLAHSTSMLANDSYIAGMSSDSELTSGQRHHHRPYSSQSRVYHAHPAPRASANVQQQQQQQQSCSRMSRYSDSAASSSSSSGYPLISEQAPASLAESNQQQQQQQRDKEKQRYQYLGQQASVSAAASMAPVYALGPLEQQLAPANLLKQQQQQQLRPKTGRQLPQRPFKQSASIDQRAPSHYQQLQRLPQSANPDLDPSGGYLEQQQQLVQAQPQQSLLAAEQRLCGQARTLRHQLDSIERQAAELGLYEGEQPSAGLPPSAGRPHSAVRRPAAAASMEQLSQERYSQADLKQQQQQQLEHHRQDLFASHQAASSPVDWLPPMPLASHQLHLARADTQMRHTYSVDHYAAASQHFSPLRQYADHYQSQLASSAHSSPVGGSGGGGGGFESPIHHHHHHQLQQQQQQQLAYQLASKDDQQFLANKTGRILAQEQQVFPSSCQLTQDSSHQRQPGEAGQLAARQLASSLGQRKTRLHHQGSSSSSNNSQSGSLQLSNLDVSSKSSSAIDYQRASGSNLAHYQQQQQQQQVQVQHSPKHIYEQQFKHAPLRRGLTSALSGLGSSSSTLNEAADLSSSQAITSATQGYIASSHGSAKRVSEPAEMGPQWMPPQPRLGPSRTGGGDLRLPAGRLTGKSTNM